MRKTWLLIVLVSFVLVACPMGCPPEEEFGSLVLRLSTSAMKTIVPPLDMEIDHYDVAGSGPDSATFTETDFTGSEVEEGSLPAGGWTFTVDAFNAGDEWIGTGTVDVTIYPGETTEAEVVVAPLEGAGTLDVTIGWPTGAVS